MRRMMPALLGLVLWLPIGCSSRSDVRAPIIDMHLHALPADFNGPPPVGICAPPEEFLAWDPSRPYGEVFGEMLADTTCAHRISSPLTDEELMNQTIQVMRRNNVYGVLGGASERVAQWMRAAPGRFYPGYDFTLGPDAPPPDTLKAWHKSGRLAVFAEIMNQYEGIAPTDERMERYWALCEEIDMPAGIHIGPGPLGVIYLGAQGYRASLHSALTLEDVLVRHPKLRVYVMHAGYPMLDDMLALMYAHPQVYVDVGVLAYTQPRAGFYRHLKGIVDAGFGKRVMFGSDQMVWPEAIERSIAAIEEAPFLSDAQKRDIFYNNAARFLRLTPEEMARHNGS